MHFNHGRSVLPSHPSYYPEIDGLRALAILPVLLFHTGVRGFAGGFVGVDVFFVISGYLITGQILAGLTKGDFSFRQFWIRRARRILPALLSVAAACVVAGWFLYLPIDYRNLGQTVFANSVFLSNVLFWLESSYFDKPAQNKPLLHTWSLSIEEQFYVVLPLLFYAAVKLAKTMPPDKARLHGVAGALAASFALSVWQAFMYPEAAFYLLPGRGWELLTGAVMAFPSIKDQGGRFRRFNNTLCFAGVAAIIAAVALFDHDTVFPGAAALLPCGGAALVIWSNRHGTTGMGKILALPLFAGLGRISYSLYLWHWPVLAFLKNATGGNPDNAMKAGALAVILVLSVASYHLIEKPIHKKKVLRSDKAFLAMIVPASLLVSAAGLVLFFAGGFPHRLSAQAVRYAAYADDWGKRHEECLGNSPADIAKDRLCLLGDTPRGAEPDFIAFGDSHANSTVLPVLDRMSGEYHVPGWFLFMSSCPPLTGIYKVKAREHGDTCRRFNDAMFDVIKRHHIKNVMLVARWSYYSAGEGLEKIASDFLIGDDETASVTAEDSRTVLRRGLQRTVAALEAMGVNVWIVEQAPLQDAPVPEELARLSMSGGNPAQYGSPLAAHRRQQAFVQSVFETLPGVHLLDPASILCADNVLCRAEKDGAALYHDDNHLSTIGAMQLRPMLEPFFADLQARH